MSSTLARPVETQLKHLEQALAGGVQAQPDNAIGRMIAVSGAQALLSFSHGALSDLGGTADFSVGTYLGIRTRTSLVIGVLCDISLRSGPDSAPATGRMDMLGEIVTDADGHRTRSHAASRTIRRSTARSSASASASCG